MEMGSGWTGLGEVDEIGDNGGDSGGFKKEGIGDRGGVAEGILKSGSAMAAGGLGSNSNCLRRMAGFLMCTAYTRVQRTSQTYR
jgi:hypothetical protein